MLWTSTFLNVSIYQFFNFRLGSEFIFHWNCYSFKEKATGNKKKIKKNSYKMQFIVTLSV